MQKTHLTSLILAALTALSACADGGPSEDAGTDDNAAFGGLDANGDGALDDADADDGALAIFYVRLADDGEPESDGEKAEQNVTASLSPGGSGGWYLNATLDDGATLSIRFENTEALSVMSGAVTNVNLNPADGSAFGYVGSPDAEVEIAEVGADQTSASGALEGEIEVDMYGMNEEPLGTSVVIKGFGFKQIDIEPAN